MKSHKKETLTVQSGINFHKSVQDVHLQYETVEVPHSPTRTVGYRSTISLKNLEEVGEDTIGLTIYRAKGSEKEFVINLEPGSAATPASCWIDPPETETYAKTKIARRLYYYARRHPSMDWLKTGF